MLRYSNLGIFLLKLGKRGSTSILSQLINDGETPVSWTIKIECIQNEWSIQFCVNPNAKFNGDLNTVISVFNKKYENALITGNKTHVIISDLDSKQQVESIVNYIIRSFAGVALDFNNKILFKPCKLVNQDKSFKILGFYPDKKVVDKKSFLKYKEIIAKFATISVQKSERDTINIIGTKVNKQEILTDNEKQAINNLMKFYFTEHERITLAMKYLKD
jgi:hypothetical protein